MQTQLLKCKIFRSDGSRDDMEKSMQIFLIDRSASPSFQIVTVLQSQSSFVFNEGDVSVTLLTITFFYYA